jgi:hypothetical protein
MKQRRPARLVTTSATVTVGSPVAAGITFPCDFLYDPTDPFAMTLVFRPPDRSPITWTFGRDLLLVGIDEPTGVGDVSIAPWLGADGHAEVAITLSSPDGELQVQARRRDVARFVAEMLEAVPEGAECSTSGFESEVDSILE